MIVMWRGAGILVVVYAALAMVLFAGVASRVVPEQALGFTIPLGLLLAAAATWFTGRALNVTAPDAQERPRNQHRLLGVPMQHWAIALVAVALVVLGIGIAGL